MNEIIKIICYVQCYWFYTILMEILSIDRHFFDKLHILRS